MRVKVFCMRAWPQPGANSHHRGPIARTEAALCLYLKVVRTMLLTCIIVLQVSQPGRFSKRLLLLP